jgi:membrane protein implicated in regulation of membrane protease activity
MKRPRLRFTLGAMMVGTAVLAILSWIIAGVMKDGTAWFLHHSLYVVIVFPLLFSASVTFVVTFFQARLDRRRAEDDQTTQRKK